MRSETQEFEGGIALLDLLEVVRRRWLLHAVGAAIGAALAVLWLSTKDPSYRAQATLLLEQEGASAGVLGDLAALTQAPVAISEMEILRSRSVAEEVVAAPDRAANDAQASNADALGLTTIVDDPRLRPLLRLKERLEGGRRGVRGADTLHATGALPEGDPGPLELEVRFIAHDQVEIAALGALGAGEPVQRPFAPDAPIEAHGATLRLRPAVDPVGRTWRVTLLSEADALERVMDATNVQETDRNSGVLRITYDDSDPARAARTVNALCRRYLARNLEAAQRRASETVGYIERSLDEQLADLASAEAELVELKASRPEFLDVSEAARALIEEHTALEVQRLEGGLARAGLSDALALLESGELSALSRVDASALDPIVQGYVESIVRLGAEAEVLERADTGAFKALLQGHALELEQARDAAALKRGTLADIHSRLAESDLSALGQLETATAAGTADPILTALVEQWTEIDGRLRRLEVDFTDALPEVRSLRAERDALVARLAGIVGARVAGLDAQLAEYDALSGRRAERVDALPDAEREQIRTAQARLQERAQDHLRARLAGLDAHDGRLGNELEGLAVRLAELPENERALARPMRAVATHSELVQLLMMRQQEAEITRAASLASAEFIDAATPPRRPTGPSLPVHVALGLLLGLAAAAGWALLRESQASGVFTSAELETASGLPVVGSIPAFKKASARRASPAGASFVPLRDEPDGAVAEAFRALRANLKFMIRSKDSGTTLAVTSSGPGEGKSMTNVDIALSFAATGKRVLLVDADMRRGSVSDYLGIARGPGLSEALQERADWRASLVTSCHDSLDVLPAGDVPASPGDLLASPRTTALVEEMRGDYDLVVLDVPPVLAVADIECVATQLDTVLLLCRSGKTLDATVQQSVSRLRLVGANVVAAVLNGVQAKRGSYGYGYGYGYGQKSSERAA